MSVTNMNLNLWNHFCKALSVLSNMNSTFEFYYKLKRWEIGMVRNIMYLMQEVETQHESSREFALIAVPITASGLQGE